MMIELTGKVFGSVREHTEKTLAAVWENALLAVPAKDDATEPVQTTPALMRTLCENRRFPVLLFAHGSSGINEAIRQFSLYIAQKIGWAVVVPDSMQTADRLTYSSPVAKCDYEAVHAMRSAELAYSAQRLFEQPWFSGVYAVAGTSEGGVAAARFDSAKLAIREKAKLIFSWSCEENYHVEAPGNVLPRDLPVLNVMSMTDKFFSRANAYLDNDAAMGYAREALQNNPNASIVLIPQAAHTLLNLPQTRAAALEILERASLL